MSENATTTPNHPNVAASSVAAPAPPQVAQKSSAGTSALVAVLAVTCGVGGAWLLLESGRSSASYAGMDSANASSIVVHLDGFTVNLADREENHFLRLTMDLAIDHLPAGASREKPGSALPLARIRDSILAVLTVCKADELLTPEGKVQLKKNILRALNRDVPEIGARDVYFTEFLVQR